MYIFIESTKFQTFILIKNVKIKIKYLLNLNKQEKIQKIQYISYIGRSVNI